MDIDQQCPKCKTTKYRNPKLKLYVNVCGHKLCQNCVDILFIRPSAACPECGTPLRRNDFRAQQFEDLIVEKEVDIRKRIVKIYNKREDDFSHEPDPLRSYNDYLEELETIVWNLANNVELEETNRKIEQYKKENEILIKKNAVKNSRDEEFVKSQIEAEGRESEERRAHFASALKEEEQSKLKEKEALLDDLISSSKSVDEIVASHKQVKKPSLFFKAAESHVFKLNKEEHVPLVFKETAPCYVYKPLEFENFGPQPPVAAVLRSKGYLSNIRSAQVLERAGGYSEEIACERALQEAFSALFT
ncbi:CDK-activating kinase assembly factor MAT1-like isoform X2 [Dendronephthya gigantea]|uniref:CDK-activating kinase assembly factor MAT1-like isoform X2 n=1 Tax=Dendronephthya gigantea TaxID=151771 RepID=UPI00106BD127|nr:CDK-activating kinase assembly factor MAT1-like isoform X2 [Dendronephthya gigantea]